MAYEYKPQEKRGDFKKGKEEKDTDARKYFALVFAAGLFLAIVFYYANLVLPYQILRAILGLLFVLFIPGYIASYAFFKDIDFIERLALSIGLSISLVVLAIMFSNLVLKVPINFETIVIQISLLCGLFFGLGRLPKIGLFQNITITRKTLYIISGITAIAIILAVDLLYPYITAPSQPAMQKLKLSEFYDNSMTVMSFYPQRGLAKNLTGVSIPETSVVAFGGNVALLSYSINSTELKPGDYFHITYYWASLNETDRNYSVKVDITDASGKTFFNQDHVLGGPGASGMIEDMEDVSDWKIGGPGTEGSSFTTSSERVYMGKAGKLSYNFTTKGNDYIELIKNVPLLSEPKKIGMMVYGDKSGHILRIRIVDANGEMYQPTYGKIDWEGWKYVEFNISKTEGHWGGDKNNIIDYPISFYSIILDDKSNEFIGNGTIYFDNLNVVGQNISSGFNEYPTSLWKKGDIIMEEYDVKVPNIVNNTYLVRVGVSDAGKLLPVTSGSFIDTQNRAIIGTISVKQ